MKVMEGSENSGDATTLGETFYTTKDGTSYVLEGIKHFYCLHNLPLQRYSIQSRELGTRMLIHLDIGYRKMFLNTTGGIYIYYCRVGQEK